MLALKSGLRFLISRSEVPFFGTSKRALLPKQKNGDPFFMPTSPQDGVEHVCFMRLALLGGF